MEHSNDIRQRDNIILKLTFELALDTLRLSRKMNREKDFILSKQILKSGTSVGANCREAQDAESKADFIHKMKIAAKEANELEYWVLLLKHDSGQKDYDPLLKKITVVLKVLNKIISSSKNKIKKK